MLRLLCVTGLLALTIAQAPKEEIDLQKALKDLQYKSSITYKEKQLDQFRYKINLPASKISILPTEFVDEMTGEQRFFVEMEMAPQSTKIGDTVVPVVIRASFKKNNVTADELVKQLPHYAPLFKQVYNRTLFWTPRPFLMETTFGRIS